MAKKKSKFAGKTTANAKKQKTAGSSYGYLTIPRGVKMFKEDPKSRVSLDFMPYIVTDSKHPDRDAELEIAVEGEQWYKRPFKIHRNVGAENDSVICLLTHKTKCPICEYRTKLMDEGAEWDDPEVKALKPSDRNLYAVIPKDHKEYDEKPHVWDISQFLFQNMLNDELEEDDDYGVFPDLEEGLTLKIRFSEEKFGKNTFASTSRIDFEQRDSQYNESILKSIPDLDIMVPGLSYAELHSKFFELTDEDAPKDKPKQDDDEDPCIACGGSGTDSKGRRCRVCHGSGLKPLKEEKEEEPAAPVRTRKEKKQEPKSKGDCPHDYVFGKDCEEHDECDDCDKWEACMDAKDALDD